jgi:hypothetical protein
MLYFLYRMGVRLGILLSHEGLNEYTDKISNGETSGLLRRLFFQEWHHISLI